MKITAKVHKMEVGGVIEIVLALSDSNLIGKTFGKNFFINPRFYKGKEVEEEVIDGLVRNATIVNVVGSNSIRKLISLGVIDKTGIQEIEGVPHAQIVLLKD